MKNFSDFRPEFTEDMLAGLYSERRSPIPPCETLAKGLARMYTRAIQYWISSGQIKNMDELRNRLIDRVMEDDITYDEEVVLNRCAQIQWDEFCEQ